MSKKSKHKVKEKKNDDENFDYMKTNKDNINNCIKDTNILPIINDLVIRTNKIVTFSARLIFAAANITFNLFHFVRFGLGWGCL